ncbi:MAG TPA: hypothetical protein VHB21_11475 [Minicystis sp.]|nr:hypothetical protein [Minicystis sp.]
MRDRPGYFDLGGTVSVQVGDRIDVAFSEPGVVSGGCSTDTHSCYYGEVGRPCSGGADCDIAYVASGVATGDYPGAGVTLDGMPSSAQLDFKLFVQ